MDDSLTTIAVFQYSSEALIIKGKLESENIRVFLADEYTVDTDPLVSNAIGGVKLQVNTKQVAVAKTIIKNIDPLLLIEEIRCLKCNSINFKMRLTFKNFILKLIPINGQFEYKCLNCNSNFKAKELL
ncbi:MAG: DUF2007 domain-containing protein [Flavobacteriaceae bacterium]